MTALLEALAAIKRQIARLDEQLKGRARRSPVCWRLMSVHRSDRGVVLMPRAEDINRLRRKRSVGAYLRLTTRCYQSSEKDVVLGILAVGGKDAIARQLG